MSDIAQQYDSAIQQLRNRIDGTFHPDAPVRKLQLEHILNVFEAQRNKLNFEGLSADENPLGAMKFLIDCGEPGGSELLTSLYNLEVYYRENYPN